MEAYEFVEIYDGFEIWFDGIRHTVVCVDGDPDLDRDCLYQTQSLETCRRLIERHNEN
jgi:hypothetical protein